MGRSTKGIGEYNFPPPLNFTFNWEDKHDDDDDVVVVVVDVVVTFNAQVAKLCLQDESHDPWTCAFYPTKHSVF